MALEWKLCKSWWGLVQATLYLHPLFPRFFIYQATFPIIPSFRLWARIAGNIHWRSILLYCALTIVDLTSRLQIWRPQKSEQHKCNVALLALPTIHQPATRWNPVPFISWWNDNLILTMICPAFHHFDINAVNLH